MKYKKSIKYKVLSIKYILRLSFLIILYTYFSILNTSPAHAETAGLRVSPSLLQIKALGPSEINAPITIENLDNSTTNLTIQLKLFRPSSKENGQVQFVTDKENHSDLFKDIEIIDNGITINSLILGPKQKKELDLRIKLHEGSTPLDYYFSVVFLAVHSSTIEVSKTDFVSAQTNFNGGIAMNVILSTGPETQALGNIEKFSAPSLVAKGPIQFSIKVHNNTTQYIKPKGNIYIKNMFGQTIGKIDIPPTNILAQSSRYLTNQSSQSLNNEKQQSENAAIWPEKFLLGFYTAQVNIQLSDKGPILTDTVRFTALPLGLIIFMVLGIITIIAIRKRVKAKMS